MSQTHPYETLVNRHLAAENAHRYEETLETLHEQCRFEDRALGIAYEGRQGAAAYYRQWWDAFGLEVRGERRHWASDTMIAEALYTGIHRGEFLGIPPTGRTISLPVAVIIGFRDGLMSGERFYYDLTTLLRQLGVDHLPGKGG